MKDTTKVLMKYLYRRVWKEKYVTLKDVALWIRQGKYEHRVNAARGLEEINTEMGRGIGRLAASWLPAVRPAVGVPLQRPSASTPRTGEELSYTGLVLLSFRSERQETLEQLRSMVNVWEQTLMSFTGSSGQSLKVLIPYRLTDGTLPADKAKVALFQQYAYKRAAEYVLNSTGMRAEESEHDGTEYFRLSHDPQVYLNQEAKAIEMVQPTEPLTDKTAPIVQETAATPLSAEVLPGYTKREMDVVKFNFICRDLAYGRLMPLDEHLMKMANECRKAGIDQELATKLAIEELYCYDKETLVRTTFDRAYEQHKLGCQNPVERTLMHQQLLEAFLKRRYMFRRNRVTGDIEYQEKYRYELWWKPLTEEARNDINNAAILEGIKVWPHDLERILVSEHIEEYDPVRQWLMGLPKWDGRDRLGELADRVPTKMEGWRDDFKVWMRSMVSQWQSGLNDMYGAQMVLMLVGAQGTRKSTFMRMLLPRELRAFYIDRIDFANKKEALRALSRFLLINIDEYDQISKAQTAFLKHLIQRSDVKERKLYSTTFEQQQRYAAFCATTNSLVPLKDDSGSRRYLVVEVTGRIDTDTQGDRQIDYPQLYAQILHEIEWGEEYAFTGEREQQIMEQNADYYEMPNAVALFEDMFHRPQIGDEVLMMSPTEILTQIKDSRKINLVTQSNATAIGSYLSRKGFKRGDGRMRRKYEVALNV